MTVPVKTQVYLTQVRDLSEEYPEVDERRRAWFKPSEAAEKVDEPELKAILQAI